MWRTLEPPAAFKPTAVLEPKYSTVMSPEPDPLTPESRLRLTGGRYEDRGLPLEGLPELVQYERLVVDVAKVLWLNAHPDRKRVPKGFSKVVGLRLTTVEDGSAIPVLVRPEAPGALPDLDPRSALDDAQDLVDRAFQEIVSHNRLPSDFPTELSSHFLRIGRTLQGNEAIEFGEPRSSASARYTQSVRKRFLTASQTQDFPVDGLLVGRITALDTDELTLTISDLSGRKIPASYTDDAMTPDLLEVFNRRDMAPVVRLDCTQLVAPDESVKGVEDIREIEIFLSSEDVPGRARLLELMQLEVGWLEGEGEPPDLLALEKARDILQHASERGLSLPGVFPRVDGTLLLQWITDTDVWTIVVRGEGAMSADVLDVVGDVSRDAELQTPNEAIDFFVARSGESGAR